MEKEKPINLEQIINLEGKVRLDINVNYGLLLFVSFISEQQGTSVPDYIYKSLKKEYDKFIKENGLLFYDEETDTFYMQKSKNNR